MLKISIDDIGPQGLEVEKVVDDTWLRDTLSGGFGYAPARAGALKVRLTRLDNVVHVQGRAQVPLTAPCVRCLKTVPVPVDVAVSATLVPKDQAPEADDEGAIRADDAGVSTYEGHHLDLADVVRDEVLLELPMRPLCSPFCAGLCNRCGEDLNQRSCGCEPQVDPRWHALRDVKLN